jgi:hypothetical protein
MVQLYVSQIRKLWKCRGHEKVHPVHLNINRPRTVPDIVDEKNTPVPAGT